MSGKLKTITDSSSEVSARIDFIKRNAITWVLLLLIAGLSIANENFRSTTNLWNLIDQNVVPEIVACGMLVMMLTGGFDLSIGAAGAVGACIAATFSINHGVFAGVLGGLAAATLVGLLNGLCISYLNVNPFVTTLGTMTLWYGIINLKTSGSPISGLPESWTAWGLENTGPIPNVSFVGVGVLILSWLLLRFTIHGGHIYAVGSNMAGAARAGVNVRAVLTSVYAIGGFLGGLAGLMTVAQTGVGNPATGSEWPLGAIAAIVIGGTRLSGAIGGVKSVIVGTAIVSVLSNALILYNVSPFIVPILTGAVVIIAVAASQRSGKSTGSLVKSTQI